MKPAHYIRSLGTGVLLALLLSAAGCDTHLAHDDAHGHAAASDDDYERGPHNGRLLRDGDIALEITIFETGVPPEFRVYAYRNEAPLDPGAVQMSIELGRLGDQVDHFSFAPQGDLLRGVGVVTEPHSFSVTVAARVDGRDSKWYYESFEGRTAIEPDVADAMGIVTGVAGSAGIRETIPAQGVLQANPNSVAEVRARFPGLVRSLRKAVGDTVRKGEELATVQSNESMQAYSVYAPLAGTIVARNAAVGSASMDEPLFVIADTSRLVADLKVFSRDLAHVRAGQPVRISSVDGDSFVDGEIDRILPALDPASRAATVYVALADTAPGWRIGQFVNATITVAETEVPLAVRASGLQAFRDFTVVYAVIGDTYEVRMLDLGRRDSDFVEVLGGLEPGTTYVTENSYLVKADIEKSGASHDH